MSLDATRWAWLQQGLRPLHKLILLALADRAGADDLAYPSREQLVGDTGADIKTIWQGLKALQEKALILDTEERRGNTGQIVVWKLMGVEHRKHSENGSVKGTQKRKHSENGSIPKTESKHSVFGTESIPKTEYGTNKGTDQGTTNTHTTPRATEDKRPATTNPGAEGTDEGESAKRTTARSKTTIPDNWMPSERCLELIDRAGIPREFAVGQVGEFVLYWQEVREKRTGWDATFLNRCKDQWHRYGQRKTPVGGQAQPGLSQHARGNYAPNPRIDNSAPAKCARAIREAQIRRGEEPDDDFLFGGTRQAASGFAGGCASHGGEPGIVIDLEPASYRQAH